MGDETVCEKTSGENSSTVTISRGDLALLVESAVEKALASRNRDPSAADGDE